MAARSLRSAACLPVHLHDQTGAPPPPHEACGNIPVARPQGTGQAGTKSDGAAAHTPRPNADTGCEDDAGKPSIERAAGLGAPQDEAGAVGPAGPPKARRDGQVVVLQTRKLAQAAQVCNSDRKADISDRAVPQHRCLQRMSCFRPRCASPTCACLFLQVTTDAVELVMAVLGRVAPHAAMPLGGTMASVKVACYKRPPAEVAAEEPVFAAVMAEGRGRNGTFSACMQRVARTAGVAPDAVQDALQRLAGRSEVHFEATGDASMAVRVCDEDPVWDGGVTGIARHVFERLDGVQAAAVRLCTWRSGGCRKGAAYI